MRHGIAVERTADLHDAERPLTSQGQRRTTQVARRLQRLELRFDGIWSSPLLRARQTANILAEMDLGDRPHFLPALAPGGSFTEGLDLLKTLEAQNTEAKIMFIGHQPDLGNWAETLIWGEAKEKLILKKAGLIGIQLGRLSRPPADHQLFLLTSPKWLL